MPSPDLGFAFIPSLESNISNYRSSILIIMNLRAQAKGPSELKEPSWSWSEGEGVSKGNAEAGADAKGTCQASEGQGKGLVD